MMGVSRALIPIWFAVGLYLFSWHEVIDHGVELLKHISPLFGYIRTPDIFAGTLPAFIAWAGLWWSQYPSDHALREQNVLVQLEQNIPIHSPPDFWSHFTANLRLQLLFIFAPIFALVLARDLAATIWFLFFVPGPLPNLIEMSVALASFAGVFLFAPVLMARVLKTEPLPPSPLRTRLEQMCERHGLRYRQILLWHTQSSLGNAAVMGILPQLRYVLLSDLLLETMPDEQIEAVFAHELGHIVYRHLVWYVIFIVTLLLALSGPGGQMYDYIMPRIVGSNLNAHARLVDAISCVLTAIAFAGFFIVFGYVSRRFERQADVFASRVIDEPIESRQRPPVRPYGAAVFASALHRVAVVNNIPVATRSWCHGSIEKRMRYLHHLAERPERTAMFDRIMRRLYALLILALIASAIGAGMSAKADDNSPPPDRPATAPKPNSASAVIVYR